MIESSDDFLDGDRLIDSDDGALFVRDTGDPEGALFEKEIDDLNYICLGEEERGCVGEDVVDETDVEHVGYLSLHEVYSNNFDHFLHLGYPISH